MKFIYVRSVLRKTLPPPMVSFLYKTKIKITKNKKFNIESNRHSQEWFSYKEFYDYILRNYNFSKFIEVGVWKGHGVIYLAKKLKQINVASFSITAIDLFDQVQLYKNTPYEQDAKSLVEMFDLNIKEAGVSRQIKKIQDISWKAASKIKNKSVDLVYIDADHSYESVTKDIKAYLPKIASGGIIAGHDIANKNVYRAVEDYFGKGNFKIMTQADTWYVKL